MSLLDQCRFLKPFVFENERIKVSYSSDNEVLGRRIEVYLKSKKGIECVYSETQFRSYQNSQQPSFTKDVKDEVENIIRLRE